MLLALDKFKGSFSADQAAAACTTALAQIFPGQPITSIPIADGGEGTTSILAQALRARPLIAPVQDALGRPATATYALAPDGTALLEMSAASGFALVADTTPDPLHASTFGTGELIRHALASGATRLLIGIGGSATNDAGTGMAHALGYRFLDGHQQPLVPSPATLPLVRQIVPPDPHPLQGIAVEVACDVDNPLLGPSGCTPIYGPQKGIRPDQIPAFEEALAHLTDLLLPLAPNADPSAPGAGAAGGLGFGLVAFAHATLTPGFDLVARHTGLADAIRAAPLILTGEGRLDSQTRRGKGPAGVARLARAAGIPLVAICGSFEPADAAPWFADHFHAVITLVRPDTSVADAIAAGPDLLTRRLLENAPLLKAAARLS
jgi:glycerate 2-kinase